MTKTVQPCSCTSINETCKDLNKPNAEEKIFLLISPYDNMSVVSEKLDKLKDVLKGFSIELDIFYNK